MMLYESLCYKNIRLYIYYSRRYKYLFRLIDLEKILDYQTIKNISSSDFCVNNKYIDIESTSMIIKNDFKSFKFNKWLCSSYLREKKRILEKRYQLRSCQKQLIKTNRKLVLLRSYIKNNNFKSPLHLYE